MSLLLHQLTCHPCEFPAGLNDFVCPIKVILTWTLLSSKTASWTLCQSQAAVFRSKLSRDKGRQVILQRFSNQNYRSSSHLLQRCSATQWILKQPWQWESKLVQSQDPLVDQGYGNILKCLLASKWILGWKTCMSNNLKNRLYFQLLIKSRYVYSKSRSTSNFWSTRTWIWFSPWYHSWYKKHVRQSGAQGNRD